MSVTDELLRNNERYAEGFEKGELEAPPAKGVAVVACMDARMDVHAILGIAEGDAHVIRNGGGIVTDDVIRSLTLSQRLLGTTEIILIHHTGCGMTSFEDEEFTARLEEETGQRPDWTPGAFSDLDESVRTSIERITSSPFVPHTESVRGFVYEVESGRLREVT